MAGPAFYTNIFSPAGITADTANTNLDGQTGSLKTLAVGLSGNPVKIKKASFSVNGTTTQNWLRVWKTKSTFSVLKIEKNIPAQTPGTNVGVWNWTWTGEIELEDDTWSLVFSTFNGDDIVGLPAGVKMT